jgi:hypothetical protein
MTQATPVMAGPFAPGDGPVGVPLCHGSTGTPPFEGA